MAEETLKKTLNMVKSPGIIVPTDKPERQSIKVDFNDFLLEALKNRPEMERARLDLKNYNIRVRYAKNQMLPDLQVTANYYSSAQGGDRLIFEGGSPLFGGRVVGTISKDIYETLKDVVGNLYKNYSISLNLSVPLSFAREKAQLTQAKLNLKRALLGLQDTETTIYSEIKNVIKELEANNKLVEANKIAMDLNWQKLIAEQKKNTVGLSTNFYVITAQNQYLQSQTQDLRSRIDYNLTLAKINQILARTLKAYNINFQEFTKEK
jgi:outer membrane protein TolC